MAAVRSVGWSVWGLFGRCLTKQVDFDSGLAYVLQQWILFYQWSKSQLYGALRTHEPDVYASKLQNCYLEGKSEARTLFFEILGPEGRQAFSRPPAFAHALAEAKGGGQPFGIATQGAWPNLAFLP